MKIDIFGSCVCRDIFRQKGGQKYKIGRCIGSVPITSIYGERVPLKHETIDKIPMSDYERRMLKIQVSQNAVELLKNSDAKILVMDLAEELMKRICFNESKGYEIAYQEESKDTVEKIFNGKSYLPLDLDMELIDQKFRQFAKEIIYSEDNLSGYQEKNICVIESYYTEKVVNTAEGILYPHDKKYKIKECNEWLKKLYALLYKNIQECRVIKMPIFTHSSEYHIRGVSPLSYTTETYDYFIRIMDVLCGKSKANSVENLYQEQGLNNKIYTRVLQSSAIYSIGGIKSDIQAMKKEITSLKTEIAALKKMVKD